MSTVLRLTVTLGVVAALAACSRKQAPELPEPVPPAPTPSAPAGGDHPPAGGTAAAPDDAASRRAVLEQRIHFDFDRWDLTAEARAILSAKAPLLRDDRSITLRIEGHADERGSDEYNLVLSNRRAAEAKRFLVEQGIEATRIEVIGLGEERPLAQGSNEQSWALNRRAEFRITGGSLVASR